MELDKIKQAKLSNPATLAFLGDAVYELYIRERLTADGSRQADTLHKEAVRFVCAGAQETLYNSIENMLTEDEKAILKRGRNAKTARVPKHATPESYRKATAMETLLGYLKLSGQEERLNEVLDLCFDILKGEEFSER